MESSTGERKCLKEIYNKFVQSIYSIQELQDVGVQCLFGQEELPSNITSGTILFYPDGGDSFSGPKTVGMNPSQLRTRKVGLALNIYTPVNDYDMQDILINYCVYALELTARSPQLVIEGGEYFGENHESMEELNKRFYIGGGGWVTSSMRC